MKTINICLAVFLILLTINVVSADSIGQWASSAKASSAWSGSYGNWGAVQATGEPNVFTYVDSAGAWAPATADGTTEWIELGYGILVKPTSVRVHETWGAGSLIKVELKNDDTGEYETVWQGTDPNHDTGTVVWSEIAFSERSYPSKVVRLTTDTNAVIGEYEEIDAVELIGNSDVTAPVPEIPTIMMVSIGMFGLLYIGHRKK